MGFLKLLLNISLILATNTIFCNADHLEIPHRLSNNIKPLHYYIRLTPYLDQRNFAFVGDISINIVIVFATSQIILHSEELEISKKATMLTHLMSNAIYKPKEYIYNDGNILTLNFDVVLPEGHYILHMEYISNSATDSFQKYGLIKIPYTDEKEDSMLAVTYGQSKKARRIFPCWDEPGFKATFNISVMHHRKYRVFSNMPVQEQIVTKNNMLWTHFQKTPIMSTYLMGIVIVSNFVRIAHADETINMWCRSSLTSQAKFAHNIAEKIPPFLFEYINNSKVVPKMDHVLIPNYPDFSIGNWGLIIYNELNVIYDDSTDPTFQKRKIGMSVAHEIMHQAFGNLITPSWWPYLWLSEGFASFFQAYFLNKIYKDWRTMDFLVIHQLHESLALDAGLLDSLSLKLNSDQVLSHEVYDKAPVILRMLHHAVTDEIFRKGVITYLVKNEFRTVTPDDLWSAMQSALQESSNIPYMDGNFKIKEVMDTWINQNQYPVLNATIDYNTGAVTITQNCFRATDCNMKWWIPITFATQENPDFKNTMPYQWLGPNQVISINISPKNWLILNVQQTAYCRVSYDISNWQKIVRYLNSEKYNNIHVLNRAQIINDVFAFLRENQIDSSIFINLTSYLSRERDYVAWYPMFYILVWLTRYFQLPESEGFKSHMIPIFDELLQDLGYEENPNDDDFTKLLRLDAAKWACTIGSTTCKKIAASKLNEHLANPNTHKISQWWQDWTYCFGLATANKNTWNKMMELYQRKSDEKFWQILSCSEDPDIIINYLNIITSNTTLFHEEDHLRIFNIILEKHARNNLVLDYILKNFKTIKPRSVNTSLIVRKILWNIFSKEQIEKVKTFSETDIFLDPSLFSIQNEIQLRKEHVKKAVNVLLKLLGNDLTQVTN